MAYKVLAVLIELKFLQLTQLLTQPGQVLWTLTVDMQEGAVGENALFAVVQKTPVQPGITQLGRLKVQGAALDSILFCWFSAWRIHNLVKQGYVCARKLKPGHCHWIVRGVAALQMSWIVELHLLIRLIRLQLHLRLGHNHYTGKEMLLQTFTFHTNCLIS